MIFRWFMIGTHTLTTYGWVIHGAGTPWLVPAIIGTSQMANKRSLNFLSWNIRGINSQEKWDHIRDKINESACSILSLQETKTEHFDESYIKKFCPRSFNEFVFSPSVGASGGLLTAWNSNLFDGQAILINAYSITVKFTDRLSGKIFHHTNIYGPPSPTERANIITWLYNFDSSNIED